MDFFPIWFKFPREFIGAEARVRVRPLKDFVAGPLRRDNWQTLGMRCVKFPESPLPQRLMLSFSWPAYGHLALRDSADPEFNYYNFFRRLGFNLLPDYAFSRGGAHYLGSSRFSVGKKQLKNDPCTCT